jgi:cytochrome c6
MKKICFVILLGLTLINLTFTAPALAMDSANGAQIFAQNCAACHANGGNIIRRGKNLKKRALQRHQKDSIEAISLLVKEGKYAMPAYADRLSEAEITAVAAYVLAQAENDWK